MTILQVREACSRENAHQHRYIHWSYVSINASSCASISLLLMPFVYACYSGIRLAASSIFALIFSENRETLKFFLHQGAFPNASATVLVASSLTSESLPIPRVLARVQQGILE